VHWFPSSVMKAPSARRTPLTRRQLRWPRDSSARQEDERRRQLQLLHESAIREEGAARLPDALKAATLGLTERRHNSNGKRGESEGRQFKCADAPLAERAWLRLPEPNRRFCRSAPHVLFAVCSSAHELSSAQLSPASLALALALAPVPVPVPVSRPC
jgi:hypothetical protein